MLNPLINQPIKRSLLSSIKASVIACLLLASTAYGQYLPPDMGYSFLMDESNYENKIDAIEAMFVNEIFVKHMVQAQTVVGFEDDEEQLLDNSQANDMVNNIISFHLSKHIAEQLDLFGLERHSNYYGEH